MRLTVIRTPYDKGYDNMSIRKNGRLLRHMIVPKSDDHPHGVFGYDDDGNLEYSSV